METINSYKINSTRKGHYLKYILIGLLIIGFYTTFTYRDVIISFFPKKQSVKAPLLNQNYKDNNIPDTDATVPPAKLNQKNTSKEEEEIFKNIPIFSKSKITTESKASVALTGTFGNTNLTGTGSLMVSLSTDKKIARYERIVYRSNLIHTKLHGKFTNTSGFNEKMLFFTWNL